MTNKISSSEALQRALYTHLSEDYPVRDTLHTSYPFILIGGETVVPADTKTDKMWRHTLTLHAYSKGESSEENKQIVAYIQDKIENGLTVMGYNVLLTTPEFTQQLIESYTDGKVYHGVLEYALLLKEEND